MGFKSFVYEVNCNTSQLGECSLTSKFPAARLVTINSVVMTDYAETVESCMRVLTDICEQSGPHLKIVCEVNPAYGGTALTQNWEAMELVKFWINDTSAEGATDRNIIAIGNATIYGSFIGPEADA